MRCYALMILLLTGGHAMAQQPATIDSAYIHTLYERSRPFWNSNGDSARYYLRQVESLSKQVGYKRGEAYALYALAFNEAVLYKQFLGYTASLEIFEQLHDEFGMGLTFLRIGNVYAMIGQPEKALDYYQRALEVKKRLRDYGGVALSLINIGNYFEAKGDLQKALDYFDESLVYRRKEGTHRGIAYSYVNMSEALLNLKKVTQALSAADSAVRRFSFTKDVVGQIWALSVKGRSLMALGDSAAADKVFESILLYPGEAQYLFTSLGARRALISRYAGRGEIRRAFELQSQYMVAKDTLDRRDYRTETLRLANEYEFNLAVQKEKREKEMLEQQIARRNTLEYLSIAIVVILIFVVLFARRGKMSARIVDFSLLIGLLLLFEFLLILTDSPLDRITNGEPLLKLLANALIGLLILPGHQFLERYTRKKLVTT